MAEKTLLDEPARARMSLLRGQMAFASSDITGAPPLLLEAATRFEMLDARLSPRGLPGRVVHGDTWRAFRGSREFA